MNILVVGAHPDDIECGMGGTVAKYVKDGHNVKFLILTSGARSNNVKEMNTRTEEAVRGAKVLGVNDVVFSGLDDGGVRHDHSTVQTIENVIKEFKPDRVYAPYNHDSHQDHIHTSLATISAARDVHSILFYETPSTSLIFAPHIFVDISSTISQKLDALKAHATENKKAFLDVSAIESLAKFRGLQTRMKLSHAECFHVFRHIEN